VIGVSARLSANNANSQRRPHTGWARWRVRFHIDTRPSITYQHPGAPNQAQNQSNKLL